MTNVAAVSYSFCKAKKHNWLGGGSHALLPGHCHPHAGGRKRSSSSGAAAAAAMYSRAVDGAAVASSLQQLLEEGGWACLWGCFRATLQQLLKLQTPNLIKPRLCVS
jgi:hypothetical protein